MVTDQKWALSARVQSAWRLFGPSEAPAGSVTLDVMHAKINAPPSSGNSMVRIKVVLFYLYDQYLILHRSINFDFPILCNKCIKFQPHPIGIRINTRLHGEHRPRQQAAQECLPANLSVIFVFVKLQSF